MSRRLTCLVERALAASVSGVSVRVRHRCWAAVVAQATAEHDSDVRLRASVVVGDLEAALANNQRRVSYG